MRNLAETAALTSTPCMRTSKHVIVGCLALLVIPAGVFVACGGDDRPPVLPDTDATLPKPDQTVVPTPDAADVGADTADAADASDAADGFDPTVCRAADAGCNDLQVCGPRVFATVVLGTLPAATGGDVLDGTYTLTDYTSYSLTPPFGVTKTWYRHTMVIKAGQLQEVDEDSNLNGGITTDTINVGYTLPDGGMALEAASFDAAAYDAGDGGDAASQFDAGPPASFMVYTKYTCNPQSLAGVTYSVQPGKLMIDLPGANPPSRLTYAKK